MNFPEKLKSTCEFKDFIAFIRLVNREKQLQKSSTYNFDFAKGCPLDTNFSSNNPNESLRGEQRFLWEKLK